MRKLITLLPLFLLLGSFSGKAQIFWVENFGTSATSGLVTAYTSTNGTWTETNLGTTGSFDNKWYVSCAEQGHVTGVCGDDCTGSSGLESTLHLGASLFGDMGASYFASAACNRRAQSPVINCSGHSGITLSFYYIEAGEGTDDDGSVYYSPDGGTTWSLLGNPAKTPTTCSPQGTWGHYSIALPASANNNSNVKIGFLWVNDADATATDPSFAIDSMSLSTSSTSSGVNASFTSSSTTICEDSCVTFTSTSTGTIDSIRWIAPGGSVTTSTTSPFTTCFSTSGPSAVALLVYGALSFDTAMVTITVNPAPHPVITASGHTLTVGGTYTGYQWTRNDTSIVGATNNTYTYTGTGSFQVIVDSGGCKGASNVITHTLNIIEVSGTGTRYAITQSGNDAFTLYSSQILNANLDVRVYDATGRSLLQDVWQGGTDNKQIRVAGMASGIYIVRLGNSDNTAVLKWLKQ